VQVLEHVTVVGELLEYNLPQTTTEVRVRVRVRAGVRVRS